MATVANRNHCCVVQRQCKFFRLGNDGGIQNVKDLDSLVIETKTTRAQDETRFFHRDRYFLLKRRIRLSPSFGDNCDIAKSNRDLNEVTISGFRDSQAAMI